MHYHARDMAVVRGHIAKIPVVLSSATPSLETEVNARRGRYARLSLPERFGGQRMPSVEAIDLRIERPPRGRFIAPTLAGAIKTALERREQALLFLNRRGYAPLTLCRACGFRFSCPNCDAWLVDHRFRRMLVCHHCGFAMPHPANCPKCQAVDSYVAVGPGVERLEEEVRELFPAGARAGAVVRSRRLGRAHARGIRRHRRRKVRHRHRHAARRQGPSLPDAQSGRRHRRRSRPRQRRSARRRAHLPASASGGRPRRPRCRRRPRLSANPPARASGDAGADRAGPRGVLFRRDRRRARPRIIRRSAGSPRSSSPAPTRTTPRPMPARSPAPRRLRRTTCACSAPPKRRSRWCAAAIGCGLLIKAPRAFDLSAYLREWLAAAPKKHGSIKLDIDVDPQSFL